MPKQPRSRIEIRAKHTAEKTEYNIHLFAANGEQLMHGKQGYTTPTDAKRGAAAVKAAAADAIIIVADK